MERDEDLNLQQAAVEETLPSREEAVDLILNRLQDGEQADLLNSYLLSGFSAGGSFALINQEGDQNLAEISQIGLSNLAVMDQRGDLNTTLLEQIGNRNIFGAWLTGNSNSLNVQQLGDENVYLLDFVGDDLNHSVVQEGNGIEAFQTGHGSRPFGIEQYGSGMTIRIEHNSP